MNGSEFLYFDTWFAIWAVLFGWVLLSKSSNAIRGSIFLYLSIVIAVAGKTTFAKVGWTEYGLVANTLFQLMIIMASALGGGLLSSWLIASERRRKAKQLVAKNQPIGIALVVGVAAGYAISRLRRDSGKNPTDRCS